MAAILAFIAQAVQLANLAIQVEQDVAPFLGLIKRAASTAGWQPTDADWAALDAMEAPLRAILQNADTTGAV